MDDRNTVEKCWVVSVLFESFARRKVHFILLIIRIKFLFQWYKFSLSVWSFHVYHFRFANQKQMLGESIDLLHKPHNAPVPYSTMYQFITEMCPVLLQNRAKKSPRIDGHIGFNKWLKWVNFHPGEVITMHLWYMYSVWTSTMFFACELHLTC